MRITNLSLKGHITESLRLGQSRLLDAQLRTTTGRRIQRPSDDPLGMSQSLRLRQRLASIDQWGRNANQAHVQLSYSLSNLVEVEALVSRAREIAMTGSNDTTDSSTYKALVEEVGSLTEQITSLMNTQLDGGYIFGGRGVDTAPYVVTGDGTVQWRGDDGPILMDTGPDAMRTQVNVIGREALAGRPARIETEGADLDPALTRKTSLSDLNGGQGVSPGRFQVTDRGGNEVIFDLTEAGAESVGDVIDLINGSDLLDVSASLGTDGRGLRLVDTSADPTGSLVVDEVDDGTTAEDLGIWFFGGAEDGIIDGQDIDPLLTADTLLDDLQLGEGLDRGIIHIVNGDQAVDVDLQDVRTVQDVIDRIDGSGAGVRATVSTSGRGLVVESLVYGTELSISDTSNQSTAFELGIRGLEGEVDVFGLLAELETALSTEDPDAAASLLEELELAVDQLIASRSEAGVALREIELSQNRMQTLGMDLEMAISDIEDVDFAQAMMDLTTSQTVYQASLATSTSMMNLNLANFI